MSSPKAMARTADRRRSTGGLHQALAPLLPADESVLTIPATRHQEQARLEAEVFLGLRAVGGLSAHPLGIVRLRAGARRAHRPGGRRALGRHVLGGPPPPPPQRRNRRRSPRPHHRYPRPPPPRGDGGIRLHRPDMPTRITLTGFPAHWWGRITGRMHRDYDNLLQTHPG